VSFEGHKLFSLLPAVYRLRDAQLAQPHASGPLQSLLAIVAEQLAAIEENLDQLYDDQFIETCAPWVIPYIGDLVGYQSINGQALPGNMRAEVANTISHRQTKGTALMLEQLAREVTGWGAHAVEFFKLLGVTQYMKHIRLENCYSPDLHDWKAGEYAGSGLDATAHTIDVRRIAVERGRYNIQNVGIFLWSLDSYSLTMTPASHVAGAQDCFRFSPLGQDIRLFNYPDVTASAQPMRVPDQVRRRVLLDDINSGSISAYYGAGKSIALYVDGKLIDPGHGDLLICDLSGKDGHWVNRLPVTDTHKAAIDPELGRIALNPTIALSKPQVHTSFYYGFSGDMGGGEYPRASTFSASPRQRVIHVPREYSNIQSALDALDGDGVVEITDSATYEMAAGLVINVTSGKQLELRAGDHCRPILVLAGEIIVAGGADSAFSMNGLVVTANFAQQNASSALLRIPEKATGDKTNQLAQFNLTQSTLDPGWALRPAGNPHGGQPTVAVDQAGVQVAIQRSIIGAVTAHELATVTISDSIVDASDQSAVAYSASSGPSGGGALTLDGCTVIGRVHASLLTLVSNSILLARLDKNDNWNGPLWADRQQQGCVRFSYLPRKSIIPRSFECVEEDGINPDPLFASLRYGDSDPGYGKLLASTDDKIRRGADDGGEMGAFHFVLAPQREDDLRVRMQEYLPAGLEFGIFYQT